MSLYVLGALPMLNRPPELQETLRQGMTLPRYTSVEWVTTEASTHQVTEVPTGGLNYELCCCDIRRTDGAGNVILTPYPDAIYEPETGLVLFPLQTEIGLSYEITLYADGTFPELDYTLRRLFALAIACVWDERFSRNWLNNQMKIKDTGFETVNESNYMRATHQRAQENRAALNDELRKYEQDAAYRALRR